MSESLGPEDLELMQQAARGAKVVAGSAPRGLTAYWLPWGTDEQGNSSLHVPGVLTSLADAAVKVLPAFSAGTAMTNLPPKIGNTEVYKPVQPDLPPAITSLGDAAAKSQAETTRFAEQNVPRVEPQNPEEEALANLGYNAGSVGVPIPGSWIGKLPGLVSGPLHFLQPTIKSYPAFQALTAGGTLAEQALAKRAEELQAQPTQVAEAQPTTTTDVATPSFVPMEQPKQQPAFAPMDQTDGVQAKPDLAAAPPEGEGGGLSWDSLPTQLGVYGGSAAALWAALKHGPRGLSWLTDVINHVPRDPETVSRLLDDMGAARHVPGSTEQMPEMPLPGRANDPTVRLAQRQYDVNAVINRVSKAITPDAASADSLIASNDKINYGSGTNRQVESMFRTGQSPTGDYGPSRYDAKLMFDRLTPGEQETAHWGRYAKAELELRDASPSGEAVNLPQYSTRSLESAVAQAEANPKIKEFLDHEAATAEFIRNQYDKMGLITKDQAEGAKQFSNFMPTFDAEGNYLHSWDYKDLRPGTGYKAPPMPAVEAMNVHYDKAFRKAIQDTSIRNFVLKLNDFVGRNPEYRGLIRESVDASGAPLKPPAPLSNTLDPHITIKTAEGPRYFEVNNTALRNSLPNPRMLGATATHFNTARRVLQSTVTGPLAAVGQKVFAPVIFARDVGQIPIQAKPGMYVGYGSKALGGRMRGLYDPSFVAAAGRSMGVNTASALAKNFADVLATKDNPITKMFIAMKGKQWVETQAERMHQRYLRSELEFQSAHRVGGGGSLGYGEQGTRLAGATKGTGYRDPLGNSVVPMQARPYLGKGSIASKVPLASNPTAVTSFLHLKNLIHDLHGVVSDAPHAGLFELNKNNPMYMENGRMNYDRLGRDVQQVIGDPGRRGGASKGFSSAADTGIPFYNTSKQAAGTMLASYRDHPFMWGSSAASLAAMYSIASHLSALVSGKAHTDFLENQISNQQKESTPIIFHGPGTDPHNHTELQTSQEVRPIYGIINDMIGAGIGSFQAHSDANFKDRLVYMLSDLFHHHVSTNVHKQTAAGLMDMFGYPLQLSPMVSAVVGGLTGSSPGNIGQTMLQNTEGGKPLLQGLGGQPTGNTLPGQEVTSNFVAKNDANSLQAFLGGILGISATSLTKQASDAKSRWDQTHDLSTVWHGFTSDVKQNFAEQNRWGNFLWNKNLPASTRTPEDERITRAWNNIKPTLTYDSDKYSQGKTRAGGEQTLVTGESPIPKDPMMEQVYNMTSKYGSIINTQLMPQLNDIYKQMDVTKSSVYNADEKVRILNELTDRLHEKRAEVMDRIEHINHNLSELVGRHVDIGKGIDWKKGVDQFPAR